jgi:ATP-dependent Clp protease ATP-binding subunit ClpB
LAQKILSGVFTAGDTILISAENGELDFGKLKLS